MLTIVDLYAKTVIAVLGFIAPTVTLLLPILGGRISVIRAQIMDRETNSEIIRRSIKSQYDVSISQMPEGSVKVQFLKNVDADCKKATSQFDKIISELKKKLKILNLKRQIKHIFISLLSAVLFIIFYYIVKFKLSMAISISTSQETRSILRIIWLSLSLLSFSYALYRLWTLICIVVEHRTEEVFSASSTIKADGIITNAPRTGS